MVWHGKVNYVQRTKSLYWTDTPSSFLLLYEIIILELVWTNISLRNYKKFKNKQTERSLAVIPVDNEASLRAYASIMFFLKKV